jgi:chaperonin GroES
MRFRAFLTFSLCVDLSASFVVLKFSARCVCSLSRSYSGIVLPDSAMPKLNEFKVIATGQGTRTREGTFLPLSVKVGDTVLLGESFGGQEIKIGEEKYHLFREEDILGIVEEK